MLHGVLIKSYKSKNILRRITLHVLVQPSNFQSHFSFLINSFGTFLESISIILFWVKEWALAFLAVYYAMYMCVSIKIYQFELNGYTHKTHSPNVIYNNIVRIIDFSSFFCIKIAINRIFLSYVYWGGRTLNPNGFTVCIYIPHWGTLSMVMFICWLLIWALNIISWISWKWKIYFLQRELPAKWINWPVVKFLKFSSIYLWIQDWFFITFRLCLSW